MPLDEDQRTSKIARCFLRVWGSGFGGFGGLGFRAHGAGLGWGFGLQGVLCWDLGCLGFGGLGSGSVSGLDHPVMTRGIDSGKQQREAAN